MGQGSNSQNVIRDEKAFTPDWAYPRDAGQSADSLLAVATRQNNGIKILEALMARGNASALIDRSSRQASIDKVLSYARKESNPQVRSLMNAYAATLYQNYYAGNRWTYDSRDLPLSPRPENMDEWSGDMFQQVIDSLYSAAWHEAGNMPLRNLKAVVDVSASSTIEFFPRQENFIAALVQNGTVSDSLKQVVNKEILQRQTPHSASWYYLDLMKLYQNSDDSEESVLNILQTYIDAPNKKNALVAWQFISNSVSEDMSYRLRVPFMRALNDAVKQSKGTWAENLIENIYKRFSAIRFVTSINEYIPADFPVILQFNQMANCSKVDLVCRRFKSMDQADQWASKRTVNPLETKNISVIFPDSTANRHEQKISIPAGCWYITAVSGNEKLNGSLSVTATNIYTTCISAKNFTDRILLVRDIVSGSPVKGAKVNVSTDKKTFSAVTDKDGKVTIPGHTQGTVSVEYNGISTEFVDLYLSQKNKPKIYQSPLEMSFTTNLGVYSAGDTVKWLGVASADGIAPNRTIEISLEDHEGNEILKTSETTDSWGRVSGEFVLPEDLHNGWMEFSVMESGNTRVNGNGGFQVADFKADELRFVATRIWPCQPIGNFTVKGILQRFNGTPVSNASVNLTVNGSDYSRNQTVETDASGKFVFVIPNPRDAADWIRAEIKATAPDGTTAEYSAYSSIKFPNQLAITKLSTGNLTLPQQWLTKVTDVAGAEIKIPLSWTLKRATTKTSLPSTHVTVASGHITSGDTISMTDGNSLMPGMYTMTVAPQDSILCRTMSLTSTLYNPKLPILPDTTAIFFLPDDNLIGIGNDNITVSFMAADNDNFRIVTRTFPAGYHSLEEIYSEFDSNIGEINVLAVRNGKEQRQTVILPKSKTDRLKFRIETFRDKIEAGAEENWTITVTDAKDKGVETAIALSIYDKRIQSLGKPYPLSLSPKIRPWRNNSLWLRGSWYETSDWFTQPYESLNAIKVIPPQWRWLDIMQSCFAAGNRRPLLVRGVATMKGEAVTDFAEDASVTYATVAEKKMNAMAVPVVMEAEDVEQEMEEGQDADAGGTIDKTEPIIRQGNQYSVLWLPVLNTDTDGKLNITATMPPASSSWIITAYAWNRDADLVTEKHEFVTTRTVTVKINAPLFVRTGDEVYIPAEVSNSGKETIDVKVRMDFSVDSLAEAQCGVDTLVTLSAGGSTIVWTRIPVTSLPGNKITVTARATSGTYDDGECISIPILTSNSAVTEAHNFFLNPADSVYYIQLPAPRGKSFSNTLNFTANPMWTVVEALPTLIDTEGCTASWAADTYFMAAVAKGIARQHPEFKLPVNSRNVDKAMNAAVDLLEKLQRTSGGLNWGNWGNQPSLWATGYFLDRMAQLKRAGYFEDNKNLASIISKAVQWYDSQVKTPSVLYSYFREAFSPAADVNGRSVMEKTTQWILKNWKGETVNGKALDALALHFSGSKASAKTVMNSLEQFGTYTPTRGFQYKNVSSLATYGLLLESWATIMPTSPQEDQLRQYLIIRRQGEAWGDNALTSFIVEKMIAAGTPWTTRTGEVAIDVDGHEIADTTLVRTGNVSVPVSGSAITIKRRPGVPAYGSLITRYTTEASDVKAFAGDDGNMVIEKKIYLQKPDGTWEDVSKTENLSQGSRVKTVVSVRSDRPLSNITITDNRPAALVAVNQLSGYAFKGGLWMYRENRNSQVNYYIDYLPKGVYLIEDEYNVNNPGTFTSGTAVVTSAQSPDLTAHSAGTVLKVKRKTF